MKSSDKLVATAGRGGVEQTRIMYMYKQINRRYAQTHTYTMRRHTQSQNGTGLVKCIAIHGCDILIKNVHVRVLLSLLFIGHVRYLLENLALYHQD